MNNEAAEHLAGCVDIACFTNAPPVQQVKRCDFLGLLVSLSNWKTSLKTIKSGFIPNRKENG